MRLTQRAMIPVTVAVAGLALVPATRCAAAPSAQTTDRLASNCMITATIAVGSPNGVAVNPNTDIIYVASGYGESVSVISGRTNKVTATIPVGNGPVGVVVNPKTNTIYVANYLGHSVSVISGRTNKVTATIRMGSRAQPGAVAVNPNTNTIYVAQTVQSADCGRCGRCEAQPMRSASETMIPSGPRT